MVTTYWKIILVLIAIISSAAPASAGIKTDKAVGNCIGYLAAQKKEEGMRAALTMADDQNRAMKFAHVWIREIARYKGDQTMIDGMVISAVSDCQDIGIRSTDY